MIRKSKKIMLTIFQVVTPGFKNLNNEQNLIIVGFKLRSRLKNKQLLLEFKI